METDNLDFELTLVPPPRPFSDDGYVLAAGNGDMLPLELVEAALTTVNHCLEYACWWPANERGTGWQLGDFSFFILDFEVAKDVKFYAQVSSEPDESILFEVSSGEWNPPADQYMTPVIREALLNRGFEPGGQAGNFRKFVSLKRKSDCRKLARELLGVMIECLGYDGNAALGYKLHLGQRTQSAKVFNTLTFHDFGQLLKSFGLTVEQIDDDNRHSWRCTTGIPFVATLGAESDDQPGHYEGFRLSMYASLSPGVLTAALEELHTALPFARAYVDKDGDLMVDQQVIVAGGVTTGHLRHQIEFWQHAQQQVGGGDFEAP